MPSSERTSSNGSEGTWHAVDPVDIPGEGRVRSVTVDGRSIALTRCGRTLGALMSATTRTASAATSSRRGNQS